jgi:hypothetical protein
MQRYHIDTEKENCILKVDAIFVKDITSDCQGEAWRWSFDEDASKAYRVMIQTIYVVGGTPGTPEGDTVLDSVFSHKRELDVMLINQQWYIISHTGDFGIKISVTDIP